MNKANFSLYILVLLAINARAQEAAVDDGIDDSNDAPIMVATPPTKTQEQYLRDHGVSNYAPDAKMTDEQKNQRETYLNARGVTNFKLLQDAKTEDERQAILKKNQAYLAAHNISSFRLMSDLKGIKNPVLRDAEIKNELAQREAYLSQYNVLTHHLLSEYQNIQGRPERQQAMNAERARRDAYLRKYQIVNYKLMSQMTTNELEAHAQELHLAGVENYVSNDKMTAKQKQARSQTLSTQGVWETTDTGSAH